MGQLYPRDIMIYQKRSDPPIFDTLEEHTKEAPWVETWNIRILGQNKSLEAGEDLLTPTRRPSKIPTNLEYADTYAVGNDITIKDMDKLWSTKELLGRDKRELLVWYYRLNHCYLKSLLRLSKRGIISRKLSEISPPPLCRLYVCKFPQEDME